MASAVGVVIVGALVGQVVSAIADAAADGNDDDQDSSPEPVVGRPTSYPLSRSSDPETPAPGGAPRGGGAAASISAGSESDNVKLRERTPEVRFSLTPMMPEAVAIVDDDALALEQLTARSMLEQSVSETPYAAMFNERPPSPKEMIKAKLGTITLHHSPTPPPPRPLT